MAQIPEPLPASAQSPQPHTGKTPHIVQGYHKNISNFKIDAPTPYSLHRKNDRGRMGTCTDCVCLTAGYTLTV